MIITPGELEPGQFISVIDEVSDDDSTEPAAFSPYVLIGGAGRRGNDYFGVVFEILSIDLPLVLVRSPNQSRTVLDARKHVFKELKKEFVETLRNTQRPPESEGDAVEQLCNAHNKLAQHVNRLAEHVTQLAEPARPRPGLFAGLFAGLSSWQVIMLAAATATILVQLIRQF